MTQRKPLESHQRPTATTQKPSAARALIPLLGELDLHLIAEGRHGNLADCLGAHAMTLDGVDGVRFALWAPNARRVAVVGDFNAWSGVHHAMRRRGAGVWELFIADVRPGALYKFELTDSNGALLPLKADPLARQTETPPATASVVADPREFTWTDEAWMAQREHKQSSDAPISIYEVHMGSWLHDDEGDRSACVWDRIGTRLIDYACQMGFTHLELMPIMEHPFGGSWGYQPLGQFAPTARYGTPADFARFVDRCHGAGLGLILDWVPAHFPSDAHGLEHFDGTALYEHADPRQGFHPDWNTLIYNLGRNEVRNFLIASALEWLKRYHADGLRVDAVASMLYLDYSREAGQWIPNCYGGRENLEAVAFLRELNSAIAQHCPGAVMIAEESTAWPGVTKPVSEGGLGFHYKWNMGWMHDTLRYMQHHPIHRRFHHHDMTFGMIYAYSEQFILPLSHDEVVHGKGSLLAKMPGDQWQRFANLRAYLGFMWGHPGKKLLFMGAELGQEHEWNHDGQLDWASLNDPLHAGLQSLVRDLNRMYRKTPSLHANDTNPSSFSWVIGDDQNNSILAFLRRHNEQNVLIICNLTPVPRYNYRVGVPEGGQWLECLNTDSALYAGSNVGNAGSVTAGNLPAHGQPHSLSLTLPPLATLVLQPQG